MSLRITAFAFLFLAPSFVLGGGETDALKQLMKIGQFRYDGPDLIEARFGGIIRPGTGLNDAHLKALAQFKTLRFLGAGPCEVTDEGLRALEKLPDLENLGVASERPSRTFSSPS